MSLTFSFFCIFCNAGEMNQEMKREMSSLSMCSSRHESMIVEKIKLPTAVIHFSIHKGNEG